ncbi:MAG: histidine kinase [Bacteroidales bacterium]|jgi:signal transduction histidine kinase|nr:histidine kinase [Bacteroidales bacterium]
MFRLVALIISIILQLIAVFVALRLTKVTRYKISWIFISVGFVFMAIRRFIDLFQFMNRPASEELNLLNDWIAVIISVLIASGVIIIPEIFNYIRKAEVDRKNEEKKVLNAVMMTEEKERKRFAKDLHDGLGPLLSTVKISLSALIKSENNPKNSEILKNTDAVISEALKSIKEISNNLSPHVLNNFGLATAIKKFVDHINHLKNVEINFHSNLFNQRINHSIEIILYRIVCELIHNSLQHAGADHIEINLNQKHTVVDLFYDDDGKGFPFSYDSIIKNKGSGLQNMISRLESIHGYYEIQSSLGKGFHAFVSININPKNGKD